MRVEHLSHASKGWSGWGHDACVADLMRTAEVTLPAALPIDTAYRCLRELATPVALVVDEHEVPLGVLRLEDVERALDAEGHEAALDDLAELVGDDGFRLESVTVISDVMRALPPTVEEDCSVPGAARIMRELSTDVLAVVDSAGRACGMVLQCDLEDAPPLTTPRLEFI